MSYSLELQGRPGYVYPLKIEGRKRKLLPGDKIKVKSKEEADRLTELKDLDANGTPLFKLIGGAKDARNSEDSK